MFFTLLNADAAKTPIKRAMQRITDTTVFRTFFMTNHTPPKRIAFIREGTAICPRSHATAIIRMTATIDAIRFEAKGFCLFAFIIFSCFLCDGVRPFFVFTTLALDSNVPEAIQYKKQLYLILYWASCQNQSVTII
jgi:hypothetical protein